MARPRRSNRSRQATAHQTCSSRPLPTVSTRSRRSRLAAGSYAEESSSESGSQSQDDEVDSQLSSHSDGNASNNHDNVDLGQVPLPICTRTRRGKLHSRRSHVAQKSKDSVNRPNRSTFTRNKRRHDEESSAKSSKGSKESNNAKTGPQQAQNELTSNTDTFIPNWLHPAVTFETWVRIFSYASNHGDDPGWLSSIARTCKALSEPAINVLYSSPCIKTQTKAKRLSTLLAQPPSTTMFNYHVKIKELCINTDYISPTILVGIVPSLPRLSSIIVFTPSDQPPYRALDKPIRWRYPAELFRALGHDIEDPTTAVALNGPPTTLKSWEWSSRFIGGYVEDEADMLRIHKTPQFSGLTKLSYINFQLPSLNATGKIDNEELAMERLQADNHHVEMIARCTVELKYLKHLVFESCTVMNEKMFLHLPSDLRHLELINCWEVMSLDLQSFLQTRGSHMRVLTLAHNQSLDLVFLTDLAENCPQLRELRINMSYYRHHDSINDSSPMYEQALGVSQKPQWPSTLRLLEILNISHWSSEAAVMFLQSIVDSAPNLPNLRYISVKTMLDDISWQKRATLRLEWTRKMEKVFLRRWLPPRPHRTLRPTPVIESGPSPSVKRRKGLEHSEPSRRSVRIAAHSDSDRHTSSPHRLRGSKRPSYLEPDTDDDELTSLPTEASDNDDTENYNGIDKKVEDPKEEFIQGLCDAVIVIFDNQKPRELQYGMSDFDEQSESSGDEWNGDLDEEDVSIAF